MVPKQTRSQALGQVRIVAGKWRSRLLPVADSEGLRPTSGRIRETLFNWLSTEIVGSRCLDLFAGSGALGFEALSRGAREASFFEQSARVCKKLTQAAELLEADNAHIHCVDALTFLQTAEVEPFDIIFVDPPFAAAKYPDILALIRDRGWLSPAGCVYLETERNYSFPQLDDWNVIREKCAGNVRYGLLTMRAEQDLQETGNQ